MRRAQKLEAKAMYEDASEEVSGEGEVLTGDAASWSAVGNESAAKWTVAPGGSMIALELSEDGVAPWAFSSTDAKAEILEHLGNRVVLIIPLLRVQFWFGENADKTSPFNATATWMLWRLLGDVCDGRYIASDVERVQARGVRSQTEQVPIIRGLCLVTGVGEDGGPAPLDENFESWFRELFCRLDSVRESLFGDAS